MLIDQRRSLKLSKRKLVHAARRAITELHVIGAAKADYHRHETLRNSVTGLWVLGFWPEQIAAFIGNGLDEPTVMMTLRHTLAVRHESLAKLIQTMANLLEEPSHVH